MRGSAVFRTGIAPGGALAGPWVRNPLWAAARAVPSLDLRFAENKSLVDATTGQNLVTFTRAGSGTYVDSQGVIRTATTNLLLRSEEFDNGWSTQRTVVSANQITAPNGTATADKITGDGTAGGAMSVFRTASATALTSYRISVYAKAGTAGWLAIEGFDGVNNRQAYFDLVNGATGSISGAGMTDIAIQSVGDGWYRCSVTRTTNSGSTSIRPQFSLATADLTPSVEDTKNFYLWGAQLEQSSTVGEYIPTTSTINSAPRFDHNPTTGESLGLLVEEQRTNLLVRSEEFDQSPWASGASGNATVTPNAIASPSGTTTADLLDDTSTTQVQARSQAINVTSSTNPYTLSVFVRPGTSSIISLRLGIGGATAVNGEVAVNLATGAAQWRSGANVGTSFAVVSAGGGWYRVSVTVTDNSTGNNVVTVELRPAFASSYTNILDVNAQGSAYFWGAQLEAGSFPTSYIPTTTATVTRSADVASITGTNFSSWYRQDEGTVFARCSRLANVAGRIITISDGTANEQIRFNGSLSTNIRPDWQIIDNGSVQANVTGAAEAAVNSSFTVSGGYLINSFQQATNGVLGIEDTSGTLPTVDRVNIGANEASGSILNGTIRRLCYWGQRLPNSTLQQITQ